MGIKRKIVITILIFIAITALIVYLIILPTVKQIRAISDAVYIERVDLEKKYQRGQLLRKTIEDFEKIRPKKDKLSSVFIMEGNELEFITALEQIAISHGIEQSLRLQPIDSSQDSKYYYPLPLSISIDGEFTKILKYLKNLEQLNFYVNISSISINAGEKNNIISANLDGEIFALPNIPDTEE